MIQIFVHCARTKPRLKPTTPHETDKSVKTPQVKQENTQYDSKAFYFLAIAKFILTDKLKL